MQTSVENLAEKQHKELKKYVLNVLDKVIIHIEGEQYDKIKDMVFTSPAGDGYGLDNHVINFVFTDDDIMDIIEVTGRLQTLKEKSKQ